MINGNVRTIDLIFLNYYTVVVFTVRLVWNKIAYFHQERVQLCQ